MLSFIPSKDPMTIAIEFDGKAVKEDLMKVDQEIQKRFKKEEKFNLYAVIQDMDGVTAKALLKEAEIDFKRWSQYHKLAVISEKKWLEKVTEASDILPGVKTRHFNLDEREQAWDWIKRDE